jgi:hypothetical protein
MEYEAKYQGRRLNVVAYQARALGISWCLRRQSEASTITGRDGPRSEYGIVPRTDLKHPPSWGHTPGVEEEGVRRERLFYPFTQSP